MMYRLRRYDVFRFAQNDVAPVGRNDAMFAQCAVRHTSLGVAVIIGKANIILPKSSHSELRQTSFKKRTFVKKTKVRFLLVPVVGVEPTRYCYLRILSPTRLPIPPYRQMVQPMVAGSIISYKYKKINTFSKKTFHFI